MGGGASAFLDCEYSSINKGLRFAIDSQSSDLVKRFLDEMKNDQPLDVESEDFSRLSCSLFEGEELVYEDYQEMSESLPTTYLQQAILAKKGAEGLEICELIISKGSDVNYANKKGGWTALHFACALADEDLVDLLCKNEGLDFGIRTTQDVRLNFFGYDALIPAKSTAYDLSVNLLERIAQIGKGDLEDCGMREGNGSTENSLIRSLSKVGFKVQGGIVPKGAERLFDPNQHRFVV